MKKCPYCAEEIQDDAIKCKHCGEWLEKKSPIIVEDINCNTIPNKKPDIKNPIPEVTQPKDSSVNIETVSKFHRGLIITVLANIFIGFILPIFVQPNELYILLLIPIIIAYCYFSFNLAKAMGKNEWVYLILGIIPGVSFFSSLILINSSNKIFKSRNIKINFLGGIKKT